MSKYIDADKFIKKFEKMIDNIPASVDSGAGYVIDEVYKIFDSLQQEQPEPYFYCKYGGTIPLCSDCKRNHSNSSFKTEEITTWYTPSNGTKHCIDYIQGE